MSAMEETGSTDARKKLLKMNKQNSNNTLREKKQKRKFFKMTGFKNLNIRHEKKREIMTYMGRGK